MNRWLIMLLLLASTAWAQDGAVCPAGYKLSRTPDAVREKRVAALKTCWQLLPNNLDYEVKLEDCFAQQLSWPAGWRDDNKSWKLLNDELNATAAVADIPSNCSKIVRVHKAHKKSSDPSGIVWDDQPKGSTDVPNQSTDLSNYYEQPATQAAAPQKQDFYEWLSHSWVGTVFALFLVFLPTLGMVLFGLAVLWVSIRVAKHAWKG